MPLCSRCSLLTIDEVVENDVLFQPDLITLKSNAGQGCEFCALCWATLQKANDHKQLDSLLRGESAWPESEPWTPTMWLRGGHFFNRGTDGAYLEVSCGKAYVLDGWRDSEANAHPTVSGRLEVYEYVATFLPCLPAATYN
jgi:hypothetical protein